MLPGLILPFATSLRRLKVDKVTHAVVPIENTLHGSILKITIIFCNMAFPFAAKQVCASRIN